MSPILLAVRDAIDEGLPNPRGQHLANLAIAFACLSFIFVCARLATRYFMQKFGSDDYLIIPALVLALAMAVTYNKEAANGFGLHTKQVNKHHKIEALKWFFVAQLLYKIATCLTKLSILAFYLRLFPTKSFKIATYIVGAVCVAYAFAAVCETIWSCNPIAKSWDKSLPGKCIPIGNVWYSTSVLSIATDMAIIILPIYQIRRLQLPMSQKVGLCLLFSLGLFVVACTIVRMATVGPAVSAKDTMYYQATSNSWTFLETNIGIICACLPVLKAPIIKFFPWLMRNKTTPSAYGYGGFSRDQYTKKDIIPSQNDSVVEGASKFRQKHGNLSDEEFILEELKPTEGGVRKTTEFNVTYEARSMKGGKGGNTKGIDG
ncbi:hypothetical protein ACMFMG_002840 [Clarireedia jacksonii]